MINFERNAIIKVATCLVMCDIDSYVFLVEIYCMHDCVYIKCGYTLLL